MSDAALLPCPFCGGLAWMHKHDPHDGFWPDGAFRVECQKCHAATTHWHTEAQAVEAWNQRAAPAVSRPAPETEDVLDDMFAAGMVAHGKSIEEVAALLADAKLDAARALDGAGEAQP